MRFKQLAAGVGLVAVLMVCAALPSSVAWMSDRHQRADVGSVSMTPVNLQQPQASPVEKLDMYTNGAFDQGIVVGTGVNYTEETVQQAALKELKTMEEAGLLPAPLDGGEAIEVRQAVFLLSTQDPADHLLLWDIAVYSQQYFYDLRLDDDSGKALRFYVTDVSGWEEPTAYSLTDIALKYAAYLGCTVEESEEALRLQEQKNLVWAEEDNKKRVPVVDAYGNTTGGTWWNALSFTLLDGEDTAHVNVSGDPRGFWVGLWE